MQPILKMVDSQNMIDDVLHLICRHEYQVGSALNFTPSENRLSPLAKIPMLSDMYGRYFLDDLQLFGAWAFFGGKVIGEIERDILHPLLRTLACARYVNTRPISGINCMVVALAATTKPGDNVLAIPVEYGGHASTSVITESMGRNFVPIPMTSPYQIDLNKLAALLGNQKPALVYIDQATMLFPLDLREIRCVIEAESPSSLLYYDSSHLNGLILGGAVSNPLSCGADMFGGSTHKTLPGPHKGFLATNDDVLERKVTKMASHLVSHHNSAAMVSLAITLLEFQLCGGERYAYQVVSNARAFAGALNTTGVDVAAAELGFTACHQVWLTPPLGSDASHIAQSFEDCGLIVNLLGGVPGIARPSLRVSMAEVTRMGALETHATAIADVFADLILDRCNAEQVVEKVRPLRADLSQPRYCFTAKDLREKGLFDKVRKYLDDQTMWIKE